jgi:uncharacterized membrane protein YbhN (UPF0104 family)
LASISLATGSLLFVAGIIYRRLVRKPVLSSILSFFIFSLLTGGGIIFGLAALDYVLLQGKFFNLQSSDLWVIIIVGAAAINFELIREYLSSLKGNGD